MAHDVYYKLTDAMLISTANCSIGDQSHHLGAQQIKNLLLGAKPANVFEKYALDIIKTEALPQEIEAFAKVHHLSIKKIQEVLDAS
jgi:hypothetical protein